MRKMLHAKNGVPDATVLVALLVVSQMFGWTLAPAFTHGAPPLDVMEGYLWGPEWVISTNKHPAFPSWVLETSRILTGAVGWPAYLVSQLFVGATFVLVFLLGRAMLGPERAAAGTLLLTGVGYYAWPTVTFNHNVAAMPFWAGVPWALWHAVERRAIAWWVLAGALSAAGLYAKLATALLLATAAAWIVFDGRARNSFRSLGPWIGLAVFAVLTAPLGYSLIANDLAPLDYATRRAYRPPGQGAHLFVLNVLLNLTGVVVLLAVAGLIKLRWSNRDVAHGIAANNSLCATQPRVLLCLTLFTAGPLVLALVGATIAGSNLRAGWASPIFSLVGLLAVALTCSRFNQTALRRLAISALVLLVLVPFGHALGVPRHIPASGKPIRVNWPWAEIADRMRTIWTRETNGHPLRIVTGDPWVAGLVALKGGDQPIILGNDNLAPARSISRARVEAEGLLIVWDAQSRRIPLPPRVLQPIGQERFVQRYPSGERTIVIEYVVIAPQAKNASRSMARGGHSLVGVICGYRLCRWPSAEYVGRVDGCNRSHVAGWAYFGNKTTSVDVLINNKRVATVVGKHLRPDVARVMGGDVQSGFYFEFPSPLQPDDKVRVEFANGQVLEGPPCIIR